MSLDYNLTAIKDRDVHFPPETDEAVVRMMGTLNRKVNAAIWATIPVQIGDITEENADEWFDRYVFWNKLVGHGDTESWTLTREDVHHLIGLKTNVWPHMEHVEWLERQFNFVREGRF